MKSDREALRRYPDDPANDPRPAKEIVTDLWSHTQTLVEQELQLARCELELTTHRAKRDLIAASASGAVGLIGAIGVAESIILLLSKRLEPWASALLVGFAFLGAAYGLFAYGKRDLKRIELPPEKTTTSLQRTAHMIQEVRR